MSKATNPLVFVVQPTDWSIITNVLGQCPAAIAGQAFEWAKNQKPTELTPKTHHPDVHTPEPAAEE